MKYNTFSWKEKNKADLTKMKIDRFKNLALSVGIMLLVRCRYDDILLV